ncbi:hypothetical protein [Klebsiella oxytoca]|uniref:hypothetical protein n=1 Tax=Klebsiella oxytoca TaxID=571 RepID=UPI002FCCD7FA
MDEKITYEEMLEQLDQKGIRVTNGARRLYVALNNGVKAEVLGNWLITSCRSANNIMPITFFLPAFIASFFYSA